MTKDMTNEERFKLIYDVYEKWAKSKGYKPPQYFDYYFDAITQVVTEKKINSVSLIFEEGQLFVIDNDNKTKHQLTIDIKD